MVKYDKTGFYHCQKHPFVHPLLPKESGMSKSDHDGFREYFMTFREFRDFRDFREYFMIFGVFSDFGVLPLLSVLRVLPQW